MARIGGRDDPDEDDLTVRDRRYESFGEQGVALATYVVPGHDAPRDHTEDGWTRGVDGVRLGDDLGETPPPRSASQVSEDDRLQLRVCHGIAKDGALDGGALDVIVHHGAVTLGGTVADDAQRRRAVALVSGLRGVAEVIDRIRIHSRR
jgi:hypothetical protein